MIKNYSLLKLLAGFSRSELELFEKFIASPFFNSNMRLLKLFRELKKYYPEFINKKLTKERLFKIVFTNKPYSDEVMRKNFSRLYNLAEEFLSVIKLKSDSIQNDLNILEQLSGRNAVDLLNKKLIETERKLNSAESLNLWQLFLNFRIQMLKFNYSSDSKSLSGRKHELSKSLENLTAYYLFYLISSYGQINAERISFKYHSKKESPEEIVESLQDLLGKIFNLNIIVNQKLKLILSLIYYDMQLNIKDKNENAFLCIYKSLIKNGKHLSKDLQHYYFKRLIVYCIIERKNAGKDRSFEALGIYQRMIKKGLFAMNGRNAILFSDFRTILLWSLKYGEIKRAENFVKNYLDSVINERKIVVRNYAEAYINFYKRNFPESLKNISKINTDSFPLKLDIYSLRARNFYEQGYYDSVNQTLDSFRHFFREGSIYSNQLKHEYTGFTKLLRKIVQQKKSYRKINIKLLEAKELNYRDAAHFSWLHEKIKELEKL